MTAGKHSENLVAELLKNPGMAALPAILDAIPEIVLILNPRREIVFANAATVRKLGAASRADLHGLRPGEALDCRHAHEGQGGCGTTDSCCVCGALGAILEAGKQGNSEQECRITTRHDQAIDLRVNASRYAHGGENYTIFTAQDISHEKRLRSLERIFFHDLLNVAGGMHGLAEVLPFCDPETLPQLARDLGRLTRMLQDEIQAQKDLLAAEIGELTPDPEPVNTADLMHMVHSAYRNHPAADGKHLEIDEASANLDLLTDPRLLTRVIGNLVKNALEASRPGDQVRFGARASEDIVAFFVQNPSVMTREAQLQIFQRSFSTKGRGRGLGTYSVKILSERYLGGRVSFTSTSPEGTIFRLYLPRDGRRACTTHGPIDIRPQIARPD